MIIIAHRGNVDRIDVQKENHPDYIKEALGKGFHVEVDVWFVNNKFVLGHDRPQYEVDKNFLGAVHKIWCHAKNLEALHEFRTRGSFYHCFYHENDAATLTSQGWIWTYPGKALISNRSIAVLPEKATHINWKIAGGICTDYAEKYRGFLK